MKLKKVAEVEVVPTSPFNFDATFHKPDHFTSGDNFWKPGVKWQTIPWQNFCFGLKFENKGTVEKPKILISVHSGEKVPGETIDSLIEETKYRYNLDLNLADFYEKFKNDKVLSPIIKKWRGMRPGHPSSLYEYLIIGMVLQNAAVRRSVQMFKALLENYGALLTFDSKELWCFWKPGDLKKVSENELRSLEVGYRAKSIKKVDDYFAEGQIDEMVLRGKDKDVQKEKLLKLYGVGPATVWYLMFDVFHQWDVFEHISPWEQKIYSKVFFNQDTENPVPVKRLLKHFEKYGEYKQLAVHYIWEDLWWKRKTQHIPWLEKQIRI